jgi:hypothetical protein
MKVNPEAKKIDLRLYVDADGKVVDPAAPNATERVFKPGEEVTVPLSDEQIAFYRNAGVVVD